MDWHLFACFLYWKMMYLCNGYIMCVQFSSVHSVASDSLRPHEPQHTRRPMYVDCEIAKEMIYIRHFHIYIFSNLSLPKGDWCKYLCTPLGKRAFFQCSQEWLFSQILDFFYITYDYIRDMFYVLGSLTLQTYIRLFKHEIFNHCSPKAMTLFQKILKLLILLQNSRVVEFCVDTIIFNF